MERGWREEDLGPGRARGWIAPGVAAAPPGDPAGALEALFDLQPADWLRRIPGRETFVAPAGAGEWPLGPAIVKRFRGDNRRDRWFERLRRIDARSPARREAENLAELQQAGFPVPRPLLWVEEPGSDGRSALAMQRVDHDETLTERLARSAPAERRAWQERAAALVGRLHGAGWYHRDLYCEHLILPTLPATPGDGDEEPLVLLDLGRARRQSRPRTRWFIKDLAALQHSAPPPVGARERLRFLVSYLAARGADGEAFGRRERRDLARAVLRKAARLARHAPRHVDPASARSLPAQ